MRRIVSLVLVMSMLLAACTQQQVKTVPAESSSEAQQQVVDVVEELSKVQPEFSDMKDERLLLHIENTVYQEAVQSLSSEEYVVEEVQAIYISKEYLDEVAFNSQSNLYFGYTLAELDNLFEGSRYVFTLGEDGKTTVQELQVVEDKTAEIMIQNVATGAGVILVCVTISAVSGGLGAPAISAIFVASAKSATSMAISSATFGALTSGIVRGIETNNLNEALKAGALGATEGFKWGAILGALGGATDTAFTLREGTKSGLTMNQVAQIQQESNLPIDIISQIHTMAEYNVYKEAGLKPIIFKGQNLLMQNIDLNYVSQLADGSSVTNAVRMQKGLAPLDSVTGKPYNLHHIGQKVDGTLAVLTDAQHKGNTSILHQVGKISEFTKETRGAFDKFRADFWKEMAKYLSESGGIVP